MKIQASSKSAFAPLRFQATRPWWKPMGKLAAKSASYSAKKRHQFLNSELHPTMLKTVKEMIGVRDPRVLQNESNVIQLFGGFLASGRVIYEFADSLTDSLIVTDFDDTTLEDLELVEGCVYLHFGDHPFLNVDGIQYEGVFVAWMKNEGLLSLQAVRSHAFSKKPIHFSNNDNTESLPVFISNPQETISSAIFNSIMTVIQNHNEALSQLEAIKNQHPEMDFDVSGALMGIGSVPSQYLYRQIVTISLSALCFLTARPDDVIETWPGDAPGDLTERAMSKKDIGRQAGAVRNLESEGYVKIQYVGATFAASSETVRYFKKGDSVEDVKRIIASHPRRGHFKRQPYGPKSSQRKMIYVAPTIVNPGSGKIGTGKVFSVE